MVHIAIGEDDCLISILKIGISDTRIITEDQSALEEVDAIHLADDPVGIAA